METISANKTSTSVDLETYDNSWYKPGPSWKIALWMLTSFLFFNHGMALFSSFKCWLLRVFGAKIGVGVIIKPSVNIKYPWLLAIGNHCWIGENVWIDNLAQVNIGNSVCLSQGAMLLTGNHDYSQSTFNLITKGISLADGVWIGARSVVCPGVKAQSHSILTVQSIATRDMESFTIYQGNPAIAVKQRIIK
jgi:putative colanic acid biosynthesis acetyltransferase WcaF